MVHVKQWKQRVSRDALGLVVHNADDYRLLSTDELGDSFFGNFMRL